MTPPLTETEAQAYLDDMVACRGHVLDHRKAMAANDFHVLRAVNQLASAASLSERTRSRATRELASDVSEA